EFHLGGLFEDEVQDTILQFDLEPFIVRQREQRTACGFERLVALHPEFLLGQRVHGPVKPFPGGRRLTHRTGETAMREWSFSASAEWVVGALLAVAIVATLFV